ncbi:MAG: biotin--[acetyl-CoA-carboxylase] ligase, partial [Desulfonatronovibrio sp.]
MDTNNNQTYFLKELLCLKNEKSVFKGRQIFQKINPESFRIQIYDSCSSSLDKTWELIKQGEMLPGDSLLCAEQSKGRGRMGRQWYSPRGNIYAAWMLPAVPSPAMDGLLSLVIGYCFRQAFQRMGISLNIKWPNDLMYNDK